MYFYGIRGNAFKIFENYLNNRQQYTIINGVKSTMSGISCGIPQGSILGPLLFLIYVNDINRASKFEITLFADDSYLSLSNHSPAELEHDVNLELTKIKAWLNQNKLTLNVQKTSYMIFSGKNNNYSFNIKFGGEELHQCSEFKYLGVILDDRMSWMPHIRKLEKKISSSVWALGTLTFEKSRT